MRITALEEYGIRCMVLMARHGHESSLTLTEFAEHERLSIPYAAKLLALLKKSGLVKSVRGRNGGYILARIPEKIFLNEIFDSLGDRVFSLDHCDRYTGNDDFCVHTDDCSVRHIWMSFDGFISNMLSRITLAEVASGEVDLLNTMNKMVDRINSDRETKPENSKFNSTNKHQ
jgi:Rrf2 family iron-sulfur cluster assembly transcriptional regulator